MILLSSSSADERVDSQITGSKLRYLENGHSEVKSELQQLNWIEMERKTTFPGKLSTERLEETQDSLFLPGSGYTKSFYLKCLEPNERYNKIKFIALLMFASEGDNSGDAIQLVSYLQHWLKILPVNDKSSKVPRLQFPVSWQALFGNAPPKMMY